MPNFAHLLSQTFLDLTILLRCILCRAVWRRFLGSFRSSRFWADHRGLGCSRAWCRDEKYHCWRQIEEQRSKGKRKNERRQMRSLLQYFSLTKCPKTDRESDREQTKWISMNVNFRFPLLPSLLSTSKLIIMLSQWPSFIIPMDVVERFETLPQIHLDALGVDEGLTIPIKTSSMSSRKEGWKEGRKEDKQKRERNETCKHNRYKNRRTEDWISDVEETHNKHTQSYPFTWFTHSCKDGLSRYQFCSSGSMFSSSSPVSEGAPVSGWPDLFIDVHIHQFEHESQTACGLITDHDSVIRTSTKRRHEKPVRNQWWIGKTFVLTSSRPIRWLHHRSVSAGELLSFSLLTSLLSFSACYWGHTRELRAIGWILGCGCNRRKAWISRRLFTCSKPSKWFFMHLIATYCDVLSDCALITSLNVPSPFLAIKRYSENNQRKCRWELTIMRRISTGEEKQHEHKGHGANTERVWSKTRRWKMSKRKGTDLKSVRTTITNCEVAWGHWMLSSVDLLQCPLLAKKTDKLSLPFRFLKVCVQLSSHTEWKRDLPSFLRSVCVRISRFSFLVAWSDSLFKSFCDPSFFEILSHVRRCASCSESSPFQWEVSGLRSVGLCPFALFHPRPGKNETECVCRRTYRYLLSELRSETKWWIAYDVNEPVVIIIVERLNGPAGRLSVWMARERKSALAISGCWGSMSKNW